MELILTVLYSAIFFYIIKKWSFFHISGIYKHSLPILFLLKVVAGSILYGIYIYYYKDRSLADIFKYFDDSKAIYDSFYINPLHFFKLITGIGADSPELFVYLEKTTHWMPHTEYYNHIFNTGGHELLYSYRTVTRINAILRFFSFGYYSVHTVFMCFVSFIGLTAIFKTFQHNFKANKNALLLITFLSPSVVFWGSGVLKEGVIIFGIGIVLYSFFSMTQERISMKRILLLSLGVFTILFTKYYLLIALIPGTAAFLIVKTLKNKYIIISYITIFLSLSILFTYSGKIYPFKDFITVLGEKQGDLERTARGGKYYLTIGENKIIHFDTDISTKNNINDSVRDVVQFPRGIPYHNCEKGRIIKNLLYTKGDSTKYELIMNIEKAGSYISIDMIKRNYPHFLFICCKSIFTTLTRPQIFESNSVFMLAAAIENIILLIFMVLCIVFRRKEVHNLNTILFCLSYVIVVYALIGLTTPISGAIVRFKIPAIPILLIGFLLILDIEKIKKKIPLF